MPAQQARARSRQQRILRAAATVIARRGYKAAAIDEIAREADTSKGGVYFHFAGKEAILLALLDHTGSLLRGKVDVAMAAESEPVAKADAALRQLLETMTKHRTLARVLAIEALGAGPKFNARALAIQDEFAGLIEQQLELAVEQGTIPPIDTAVAGRAWMGALQAVIQHWLNDADPAPLETTYSTLRRLLLNSVGADSKAQARERQPA